MLNVFQHFTQKIGKAWLGNQFETQLLLTRPCGSPCRQINDLIYCAHSSVKSNHTKCLQYTMFFVWTTSKRNNKSGILMPRTVASIPGLFQRF